jgi:hypothetical protein
LATRLRVAMTRVGTRKQAGEAAEAVLAIGPSHAVRVEAAQGLARAGNFARAREVLVAVARDPGAPDVARADAYALLMRVVGDEQGDWNFAAELHGEWTKLAATDSRLPAWAPRVANRRRRGVRTP